MLEEIHGCLLVIHCLLVFKSVLRFGVFWKQSLDLSGNFVVFGCLQMMKMPTLANYHFFQRDTTTQAQPSPLSPPSSSGSKTSPAILFIIIVLAIIFFISGLLHLLVRFFMKQRSNASTYSQSNRFQDNISTPDAFQRQLQQLFHLHDSGLDQAFIDALPLFQYKEIVGLKEPFDCAVCLCEFTNQDKLRLLPLCSHAFHIDCIDTWLLSNSTCPLCRGALYGPGIENPAFEFDDLGDIEDGVGGGLGSKSMEIVEMVNEKRVFSIRLGKFKSTNHERDEGEEKVKDVGESSSSSLDARRCFSMGSYQYVVGDSTLQVALCPKRPSHGGVELKSLKPRQGQNGNFTCTTGDAEDRKINVGRKQESLSVSKIWLWSNKKGRFPNSSNSNSGFGGVNVDMSLPWNNKNQAT